MAKRYYKNNAKFIINGQEVANTLEGIQGMEEQFIDVGGARGFIWTNEKWEKVGDNIYNRTADWTSNILHGTVNETWEYDPVSKRACFTRNELTSNPLDEALVAAKKAITQWTNDANDGNTKDMATKYYKNNAKFIINGQEVANTLEGIQGMEEQFIDVGGAKRFIWTNEKWEKVGDNTYKRTADWNCNILHGTVNEMWEYDPVSKQAYFTRNELTSEPLDEALVAAKEAIVQWTNDANNKITKGMAKKFYKEDAKFILNGEVVANTLEGFEAMGEQMVHVNGAKGFIWFNEKWVKLEDGVYHRTGDWTSNILHGTVNEHWEYDPVSKRAYMRKNELTSSPNEV